MAGELNRKEKNLLDRIYKKEKPTEDERKAADEIMSRSSQEIYESLQGSGDIKGATNATKARSRFLFLYPQNSETKQYSDSTIRLLKETGIN